MGTPLLVLSRIPFKVWLLYDRLLSRLSAKRCRGRARVLAEQLRKCSTKSKLFKQGFVWQTGHDTPLLSAALFDVMEAG